MTAPASGSLLELAHHAVDTARARGAAEVAVAAARQRQVDVEWRDGKLEKISQATTRGMTVQLYVDGRYAAVSTSDLRPAAVERFLDEAVALTRTLAVDPHRRLPEPALYTPKATVELDLEDPTADAVTAGERRHAAEALEALAHDAPGKEAILSVTSSVGDVSTESCLVTSNGFAGQRRSTSFYMGASVSVRDADGRRPEESQYATTRHRADLPPVADIAAMAAARAMGRLGSRVLPTAVVTMVVSARAAAGLVARLLAPLSAAALQQRRSFYDGRLGEVVGSERLTITDEPHVVRGLGSRLYDGEGVAARPLEVFSRGTVRSAYVDTYYGRKLGLAPTTGGASNLTWALGERSEAELVREVGSGVLVTGFLGGNSNGTTGDFSLGVEGFRIVGGRRAEPFSEMNVAGNHLTLWRSLSAVGNDPYPWSAYRTPTLVFEGVQLSGTGA